jgi:hypothetical protein
MRSLRPSIAIADFDDAVENHLVGKINDLGPPSGNPEEDDDRIEALRSDPGRRGGPPFGRPLTAPR